MPRPVNERAGAHPPGSPVVVGPADADPGAVREATKQLSALVTHGTEVAAGAGVDLGGGFTSARLAGAHGDRRDAVLAALKVLGIDRADKLGDRNSTLVALFGPSATKPVGAAANAAIGEERWPALQLASAASDLLGPEQVERLLALRAPDGIDPFPRGAASTLADHLSRVLSGYRQPRRLNLIVSLWDHVCAQLAERERVGRRPSTQTREDRIDRLRERHRNHFDEVILWYIDGALGAIPSLAAAARWRPPRWWAARDLGHLLNDAIAATALLRFARTMSDEGLAVAIEKHYDELVAADQCLPDNERAAAERRTGADYNHPARPGCYVNYLCRQLQPGKAVNARVATAVKERAAMARNYGVVVLDASAELINDLETRALGDNWASGRPWQVDQLRKWRAATGFSRAPGGWEQPPLPDAHKDGPTDTLAQRIAAAPGKDPAEVEAPHDLLWFADLADALAPFYGNDSATVKHALPLPTLTYDAPVPWRPTESVPLMVAEVAQLVAFGAKPPPRCRSWAELMDGIGADAVVAEASVGSFPIPAEVSGVDGQTVPGTSLTVELGRDPRQLSEWSAYMGNCIGDTWYTELADEGQCVLMALRDSAGGRIIANLDVRRGTGGWQVHELRARFNDVLPPAQEKPILQWVRALPVPEPAPPEPLVPVPPVRARGGSARRSTAGRLPAELTNALVAAVDRELASAASARRTYAVLARGLGRPGQPADFDPDAAVIALKRVGRARHIELVRTAVAGGLGALVLWQATRVRPLAAAVGSLDPQLRDYDRLETLTTRELLPRTLRALVRSPEIAPAYAMDVVARDVRQALGQILSSEALIRSVARKPSPELVCVLAIAATCARRSTMDDTVQLVPKRKIKVPGFPATKLFDEDGPWQRAMPAAAELGVRVDLFAERIAEHGLLLPAALLGRGGWAALWTRAHRR